MSQLGHAERQLLRPIESLLGKRFYVAQYQRGYKWREDEVTKLLDDIRTFEDQSGGIYCLQPLVIARKNEPAETWELIDGQQRLTTIFIILQALRRRGVVTGCFQIDYQTRPSSREFLLGIGDAGIGPNSTWESFCKQYPEADNIDNFHFHRAWKTVTAWLTVHAGDLQEAEAFARKLLNQTAVIWHTVVGTDHFQTFLNLNSGKIELTKPELIRGLFLRSRTGLREGDAYRLRQKEISQEWDRIEYTLQDNEFWFFVNRAARSGDCDTRIGFIFDCLATTATHLGPFEAYLDRATAGTLDVEKEWERVKTCFRTLQEWHDEPELYHLLGFLICQGKRTARDLLDDSRALTKSSFLTSVRDRIKSRVRSGTATIELEDLNYGDHRMLIADILLLFNIESTLKNGGRWKFPFDAYRSEDWSLEHIHAQNAKALKTSSEWGLWADQTIRTLESSLDAEASSLVSAVEEWKSSEGTEEEKEQARQTLAKRIFVFFGDAEEDDNRHGIGNLALLSQGMNSSLSNGWFPEKRSKIIEWDRQGKFIPLETKNVFLKYHSGESLQIHRWTRPDQEAYLKAIKEVLSDYLE